MELPLMKLTATSCVVRTDNFIASPVDSELVMMNIEKGNYYGLDEIGTEIWGGIQEPIAISELCARLTDKFDVDLSQCETDTLGFLNELLAEGMIKIVTQTDKDSS